MFVDFMILFLNRGTLLIYWGRVTDDSNSLYPFTIHSMTNSYENAHDSTTIHYFIAKNTEADVAMDSTIPVTG